jgi:hypothetical protein
MLRRMPSSPLAIWEFPPDADPDVMASIALERKDAPDARGLLVSTRGAVLTVQLVEGTVVDSRSTFHVQGRGGHVLERREVWPAREPGGARRELLVLRASGG